MSDKIEESLQFLADLGQEYTKIREEYDLKNDAWWNGLSEEERQEAFYAVCKRIHKGDIVDKGTYRHVLYDVFEFDPGMYMPGMDCGYMNIHNHIFDGTEREAINHVNRIEVIDNTGRCYTRYLGDLERPRYMLQDDNKTLKIFIDEVTKVKLTKDE